MLIKNKVEMDPSIFRAYDIRGIVGVSLTDESVYTLGRVLGSLVIETGDKRIAVGRDGRLSSPNLAKVLCDGIVSTGCDVINIGMVPTPLLYYCTHLLETKSGVMLTGSHNPSDYNGLKIVINGKALSDQGIQDLYQRAMRHEFKQGDGYEYELEVMERYVTHVNQNVKINRPLKIVVDAGNGVTGEIAPILYRALGCDVHELHCKIDGRFPAHHPDPSEPKNLKDLVEKVRQVGADLGLAFDGDGDRIGVVTSDGEIIFSDRLMMLFSKALLQERPNATIIYDVKCSTHLGRLIKQMGGEPVMWKTGHSLIKAKLAETQALLAGEMSGHIFFKDRWYGFDDGLYAGARLLEILSNDSNGGATLFSSLPNSVNTPELKMPVADNEKYALMEQLIGRANFPDAQVSTLDGLRVNFSEGWGLVRPSNTTPCLVFRFEAENEKMLVQVQDLFRELLLSVNSKWVPPF